MATGAPIPVREYTSADEMRRHAAEVRARLFAPRRLPTVVEVPEAESVESAAEPEQAPAPKAWSKPQVEQVCFVAPEAVTPKGYHNSTLHPVRRMMSMVGFITGVLQIEIRSQRRTGDVVKARQILFYICKTYTLHSLPEIGRRVGGKDHTTVLHGVRRVQDAIQFCNIEISDDPITMASRLWSAKWPKWTR